MKSAVDSEEIIVCEINNELEAGKEMSLMRRLKSAKVS